MIGEQADSNHDNEVDFAEFSKTIREQVLLTYDELKEHNEQGLIYILFFVEIFESIFIYFF